MIQRRAARWVTGCYHNTPSVTDMLKSLDWRTLEQRRVDSRLCILYKIRNHLVASDEDNYIHRGTRRHSQNYRQLRAVKITPILSQDQHSSRICLAESLEVFKTQIAKIERSRFNYFLKTSSITFFFPSLFFLLPESEYLTDDTSTDNSSFPIPSNLPHFFIFFFSLSLSLIFPFSHSTGDNPQIWGQTCIMVKTKKKKIDWSKHSGGCISKSSNSFDVIRPCLSELWPPK